MEILKELFDNIEYSSYIKKDKLLETPHSMIIGYSNAPTSSLDFNYSNIMYSSVVKEICYGLEKSIIDEISLSNRHYIDLTNEVSNDLLWEVRYKTIDSIVSYLASFGRKNCLVSQRVATMFMDSKFYHRDGDNSKLCGINLYVDTGYSTNKRDFEIFLFDDISANINLLSKDDHSPDYNDKIVIRYKQGYTISNNDCVVVLYDKESPNYMEYKLTLREDKLKSILDD